MDYGFKDCKDEKELKVAYKKWVVKLHPDRNPNNPNAEEEFKDMQAQYECRLAELNGDYSKSRKYDRDRQQRERDRQRREEEARQEEARRKVERVVEEARKNRTLHHTAFKVDTYFYAQKLKDLGDNLEELLRSAIEQGVEGECVVKVEEVVEMSDADFLKAVFNHLLNSDIPLGGYEVLQTASTMGRGKGKRVAKVVVFRSPSYCVAGNPMGDQEIQDYYFIAGKWETMFETHISNLRAKMAYEAAEVERKEIERRAKMEAKQAPLINEWKDKLIEVSVSLSTDEITKVAMENLRVMLNKKFPGSRFKVTCQRFTKTYAVDWEDGPTEAQVREVTGLFTAMEETPWQRKFGWLEPSIRMGRKMSVLAKARILQQLGQVTMAFRNTPYEDYVTLTDFDWTMLHAMAGIDLRTTLEFCKSERTNGAIHVRPHDAVRFVFEHTGLQKSAKRSTKRARVKSEE